MTVLKKSAALLAAVALLFAGCAAPASNASEKASSSAEGSSKPYGCPADESSCEAASESPREEYQRLVESYTPTSFDEAIDLFETKDSALVYFGFPDCPWCDEVVPILSELAKEQGVEVLYVRTRDDEKTRLYTDEQRDEIKPYLSDYIRNNLKGEPTLYVPLVISIRDGKVSQGHQGTVDEHDAKERVMTDEERQEVEDELRKIVDDAARKD